MHDHIIDGMLQYDRKGLTPRALRVHLDEAHDARTSGWDFDALDRLHHKLHNERLAEIDLLPAAPSSEGTEPRLAGRTVPSGASRSGGAS